MEKFHIKKSVNKIEKNKKIKKINNEKNID